MVTICQTCGDEGWSVALIYCDKCQIYAVHRYCLDVLPATYTEYVTWFCDDCAPKVVKQIPEKSAPAPVLIRKSDRAKSAELSLASEQVEILRETQTSLETTNICGPITITKAQKIDNACLHSSETSGSENHERDPDRNRARSPIKSQTSLKRKKMSGPTTSTEVKKHETSRLRQCNASGSEKTKLSDYLNLEEIESSKMNNDKKNGQSNSNKADQNLKLGKVESSKISAKVVNHARSMLGDKVNTDQEAESGKVSANDSTNISIETHTSLKTINLSRPTTRTKAPKHENVCLHSSETSGSENHKCGPGGNRAKRPNNSHTSVKSKNISGSTTSTEDKKNETSRASGNEKKKSDEYPNFEDGESSKINDGKKNGESESNKLDPNQKLGSSNICPKIVNQAGSICEGKVNTDQHAESGKISTNYPTNIPEQIISVPAQPIMDPVWRGRFSICDTMFSVMDGLAAHLSTHACPKVCEEARLLPELLFTDMLPRDDVWPNSFRISEPTDDHIALYIFPENERDEKGFDKLVEYMIEEDLAMRAVALNAELLIFTSCQLPVQDWRFEAKYYLWGVFRRKQETRLAAHNSSNESNITAVSTGPEKNGRKNLSPEGRSPISHLSNGSSRRSPSVF